MDRRAADALYRPAAMAALAAFDIDVAELSFVALGENIVWRVIDAKSGSALVLRLHRPGYHSFESLCSERVWTRALAETGVEVPPYWRTPQGQDYVQVAIPEVGERRWAGLARWIEGDLLSDRVDAEPDPASAATHFRRLGALMAAMHRQSAAWTPPPGFIRHALDADGLMGKAPFWGPFWAHPALSTDQGRVLLDLRDRLHAALVRYGKPPQLYGMIHADLHPGNVLVRPGAAAVIDFDDAGFGWRMYDLAVALFGHADHPHYERFRRACFEGYAEVEPLPDGAEALLPMFLLVRNLAVLGWLGGRPEIQQPARVRQLIARGLQASRDFVPPV